MKKLGESKKADQKVTAILKRPPGHKSVIVLIKKYTHIFKNHPDHKNPNQKLRSKSWSFEYELFYLKQRTSTLKNPHDHQKWRPQFWSLKGVIVIKKLLDLNLKVDHDW